MRNFIGTCVRARFSVCAWPSARRAQHAHPLPSQQLLLVTETDGCFADGLLVATGCSLGHRTLRLVNHGKLAATVVDALAQRACRLVPRADVRQLALGYAPDAPSRWHARRDGYARRISIQRNARPFDAQHAGVNGAHRPPRMCSLCHEEAINQLVEIGGWTLALPRLPRQPVGGWLVSLKSPGAF